MLRKKSSHSLPSQLIPSDPIAPADETVDFDIQKEVNRIEEIILDSFRIPLTRRTVINEDQVLNQLDLVRINFPEAFEKALEVIRRKQKILQDAEDYAQNQIRTAHKRAAQILDEMEIVRRAEREAGQIRQKVQHDCDALQQKTLAEVEQMRRAMQQELEQLRQKTLAECEEMHKGADVYADSALERIEHQLSDMLKVIRNGRQQLHQNSPRSATKNPNARPRS